MPGKSKKGGGLTVKKSALYKKQKFGEAKSPFTMTYKHSAFPFKNSPMKLDEGTDYTPFTPPPPTTTPTTTDVEGGFTTKYDFASRGSGYKSYGETWGDPGEGPSMMVSGTRASEFEKAGGAVGLAVQDLDKRVTNLGG